MGTNYYIRLKATKVKQELAEQLRFYTFFVDLVCSYMMNEDERKVVDESTDEEYNDYNPDEYIHLGKSSSGWRFSFNKSIMSLMPFNEVHKLSQATVRNLLSNCRILDEYGEVIDDVKFWNNTLDLKGRNVQMFQSDDADIIDELSFSHHLEFC